MSTTKSSLKSTLAVSLTNYLDAGAIVAGASGLTLWQSYLGLTEGHLGWLNAISANCLGAAIGAIIGGQCWADSALNTPDQIQSGKVTFDFDFTPPYPAEHITFRSRMVSDYLEEIFE